jgi:hypothetical protein
MAAAINTTGSIQIPKKALGPPPSDAPDADYRNGDMSKATYRTYTFK